MKCSFSACATPIGGWWLTYVEKGRPSTWVNEFLRKPLSLPNGIAFSCEDKNQIWIVIYLLQKFACDVGYLANNVEEKFPEKSKRTIQRINKQYLLCDKCNTAMIDHFICLPKDWIKRLPCSLISIVDGYCPWSCKG